MPTVLRTNLATILPYLVTRLQEVTGFSDGACFLSQRADMPYDGIAEQYIWLKSEDATPNLPVAEGAGRHDARDGQVISVTVRTRLALDLPHVDTAWLTDASKGHLNLTHSVANALWNFYPLDGQQNALCTHPVVPHSWKGPRKPRSTPPEWGESTRYFEFEYVLDLDQSYQ